MPKRWNIRTAIIAGLLAGAAVAIINFDGSPPLAFTLGRVAGALIGGAFIFAGIAAIRNRLVIGNR